MISAARFGRFFLVPLLYTVAASAQQNGPLNQPGNDKIYLDVVVTSKSGPPITGLQQEDFTILDNGAPRTISSFEAVDRRQAPIEVLLVIDAINTAYQTVAYERTQIDKFFLAEGGRLAYPVALAVVTDTDTRILGRFSNDGTVLSASLGGDVIGLRGLRRGTGYNGATERLQLSLEALRGLVASEASRPGRKIMVWVSPGWPLLSGPSTQLDSEQQRRILTDIVSLSTQLRQSRVTLYSIDPLGSAESLGNASYYKTFVKGVSKLGQVKLGDLALQVLALQSGGLAFNFDNDVAGLLRECLADAAPYYTISFDSPLADQQDEYHHLEIKLAKPGLRARTREGYYAEPLPRE